MAIPCMWIMNLFKILQNPNINDPEEMHEFNNFIDENYNILSCRFSLPWKRGWKGNSFYYETLKGWEKFNLQEPQNVEKVYSVPIWFNKRLKTKFDRKLSF